MEVDDSAGNVHACPRDFVKQISVVMDENGSQTHPRQAATRVSTKSKAPSPPGPDKLNSPGLAQWYPGNPATLSMDHKDNLIDKELSLVVVLPGGVEKMTTVHGSKPLMDLLVTLCAKYHLNPSGHTLELVTTNRNNIKLKPNALIGTLDAEKIVIKPKGEDKNKKTGPQMPEATVRMVINYKQTQKTILRVNPRVPLAELLPAICEKCEFEVESTVLLKDVRSLAPLDLSASLNDYAIREVYARDTRVPASPVCPAPPVPPTYPGLVTPSKDKNQKEKENKGLFSMFRRSKKSKPDQAITVSAPSSPVLPHSRPRPLSMALPSTHSSPFGSPGDAPKKRRAPQPPILVSQMSVPCDFSPRHRLYSEPTGRLDSTDLTPTLSRGSSTDSSLKRTKRKAPPPPTSPGVMAPETLYANQLQAPANTLEEIKEQEEINSSAASTAASNALGDFTTHNASHDVTLHTPPPETATEISIEQNGEELSSGGNQLLSEVNDSANAPVLEKVNGDDLTETADTNVPSTCEDCPSESVQRDSDTLPSPARLCSPPLVRQDAEVQAPPPSCADPPEDPTDTGAASQPSPGTVPQSAGEDAQIQTDFTPLPQQQEIIPSSVPSSPSLSESSKKDMATLTDDLEVTLNLNEPPSPAKGPSSELESKPKPSNELTRDYIPKVGMTTYTIVPQKSLEKLRYFEVALTLESPPPNCKESHEENTTLEKDIVEKSEQSHDADLSKSGTTLANQGTVNGSILEESVKTNNMSSATIATTTSTTTTNNNNTNSPAGSPTEVKDIKIPPATKPKPGSFRLPQHKKTPGYYVTSAAEKSQHIACSGTNQRQGNPERDTLPPPPLPPAHSPEKPEEGAKVTPESHKGEEKQITRQSSLGLSLEKLRSFAAPRPYSPSTPSRFAQAVSSAVKKSQSLSSAPHSPRSPTLSPSFSPTHSPKFSPVKSPSLLLGVKEKPEVNEMEEQHTEKVSTTEQVLQVPSFSGIVEVEGETHL